MFRCNEFRDKRELVLRKSSQPGYSHKNKGHFGKDFNRGGSGLRGSPTDFHQKSFSPFSPRPSALLPSLLSAEIEPPPQQKQYKVYIPPAVPQMYSSRSVGYFDASNGREATQYGLSRGSPNSKKSTRSDSYKTVMCQSWLENNSCHFGENCRFAHGEFELRPVKLEAKQNGKYKTKLCDKYTTTGVCPYGARCLFIHPEHGGGVEGNDYIRADKMVEIATRHAAADKQRITEALLQAPLYLASLDQLQNQRFAVDGVARRGKDEDNGEHLMGRAFPSVHPSWPLEPKMYKNASEPMPLRERQNSFSDIIVNLEQFVVQQSDPSAPLNIARRTPSPVPSERMTMGTATPASGYVTGESSPAIRSFLGEHKPFNSLGISPFSMMGISSDSHYSSNGSISGEDIDGQEMNIDLNFDFLKDQSFNGDEKTVKGGKKASVTPGHSTYDPFTYTIMNDNFSREWCKDLSKEFW